MYKRLTHDEWQVQGNYGYGHGFKCVDMLNNRVEAEKRIKVYRKN